MPLMLGPWSGHRKPHVKRERNDAADAGASSWHRKPQVKRECNFHLDAMMLLMLGPFSGQRKLSLET